MCCPWAGVEKQCVKTKEPPLWERLQRFALTCSGGSSLATPERSGSADVVDRDLAGAAVLGRVEGDFLAFDEAAHAGALKRRCMDEDVLAAVVRLDEAEAFLIVVELNGTRVHGSFLVNA